MFVIQIVQLQIVSIQAIQNTVLEVKGGEISLKHFIYKTWIFIRTNALLINFNTKQTVGLISFKIILEIFHM